VAPAGPGCLSGSIACGETVKGTTVGGSTHFDGQRYRASYCFPAADDAYTDPERVYAFELPADNEATFTLDSPCAELDLVVLRWEGEPACPGADERITECEGDKNPGGGSARLWNDSQAHYLLIVDGDQGAAGNFTLSVSCRDK